MRIFLGPGGRPPTVAVLPVYDGAAVLLAIDRTTVLFDAGRHPDRVAELLADAKVRKISAVIASHTDEDHIGGMTRVLKIVPVDRLLIPKWMATSAAAVPLLRAARSASVPIQCVAAGTTFHAGRLAIEVVWPPAHDPPSRENERSLVFRAAYPSGSVVATADIGRRTERLLPSRGRLAADILVVPHHGSRDATSAALLDAVSPDIALIPAAPGNTHGHPHSEVLRRLRTRHILARTPTRERACGAVWQGNRWLVFP
jgi:competence protein ComEC